jgi:hypothetical protein
MTECAIRITDDPWTDIIGVGVQWDPRDRAIGAGGEELNVQRVQSLRPSLLRVMIDPDDFFDRDDEFTPITEGRQWQRLIDVLDAAQEGGAAVIFGVWNIPSWINDYAHERWLRALAHFVADLLARGFTCIRYVNYVNEPNGDWMIPDRQWEQWAPAIPRLRAHMVSAKISHLGLVGPDSLDADEWVEKVADELREDIGLFQFHVYGGDADVAGAMESRVRKQRDLLDARNISAPLVIGELGSKAGEYDAAGDQQPRVADFAYGLEVASLTVLALRGGAQGVVLWMLDDAMHLDQHGALKTWGMWNTLAEDTSPRPWAHVAEMLTSELSSDARIGRVECERDGCFALAIESNGMTRILLVNAGAEDILCRGLSPRAGGRILTRSMTGVASSTAERADGQVHVPALSVCVFDIDIDKR